MLKKLQKKHISLIAGAGLSAFLLGAMVSAPEMGNIIGQWLQHLSNQPEQSSEPSNAKSVLLPLVLQSPQQRAAKLEALAKDSQSPEQNRARYLLASDLIEQKQAKDALSLLKGLEKEYSLLAPYVLLKQAQAYDLLGQEGKASDLRHQVLKLYPKHPAAAKALYLIGQPEDQAKLIAQFPSHPLTWEVIRQKLLVNPNQPQLQLLLAKYAYDQASVVPILDQLLKDPNLKPDDWEIIATGYWENNNLIKAATAYAKARPTPRNLYRIARGLQLSSKRDSAITAYQRLVSTFPDAKETGLGLLHLAQMVKPQESIPYLNQVISKFPDQASEALLAKVKILQAQQDQKSANEALQVLISKYAKSPEAAEYRWKVAQGKAKAKDYKTAWQWAQPILINNPDSILAPRAGFWMGKWATKLGKQEEAKKSYEYVLSQFPYSYYAWRSAAILGLNVGNFNTLRQMNPEIIERQRPVPPSGSDTFKELYLLGQDHDAWLQWQAEFQNKMQPTVNEQFTEGLLRLAKGDNLIGIDKISKLQDREKPEEKAQYEILSKQTTYWQARYPFPYLQAIEKWSKQNQLNPLLVTALIRQESRFEPKVHSAAGAIGLMQLLPSTANLMASKAQLNGKTFNLENPNDNIMLGTLYLDYTYDQYKNNSLLAVASYNAGPGNVAKWLQTLPKDDPDDFVEAIPFDETKNYVRQVFGNYWNYLRLYNPETAQIVTRYSVLQSQLP
jgi:soluble lytic murein transglycosylase